MNKSLKEMYFTESGRVMGSAVALKIKEVLGTEDVPVGGDDIVAVIAYALRLARGAPADVSDYALLLPGIEDEAALVEVLDTCLQTGRPDDVSFYDWRVEDLLRNTANHAISSLRSMKQSKEERLRVWTRLREETAMYSPDALSMAVLFPWNYKLIHLESTPAPSVMDSLAAFSAQLIGTEPKRVLDLSIGSDHYMTDLLIRGPQLECSGLVSSEVRRAAATARFRLLGTHVSLDQCRSTEAGYQRMLTLNEAHKFDAVFQPLPVALQMPGWKFRPESRMSADLDTFFGKKRPDRMTPWITGMLMDRVLAEGGIGVAVLPQFALWRRDQAYFRDVLLERQLIHAVIQFPGSYSEYGSDRFAVIVLFRHSSEEVQFIDAGQYVSPESGAPVVSFASMSRLRDAAETGKESKGLAVRNVRDILAKGGGLNPGDYFFESPHFSPSVELSEVSGIQRGAPLRAEIVQEMLSDVPTDCSLVTLPDVIDGCLRPTDRWLTPDLIPKTFHKYLAQPYDVLVAKTGEPRVAVFGMPYADEEDAWFYCLRDVPVGGKLLQKKALVAENFYILHPDRDSVNPFYLAAFLSSSIGRKLLRPGTKDGRTASISGKNLSRLPIYLPDMKTQERIGHEYVGYEIRIAKAQKKIVEEQTVIDGAVDDIYGMLSGRLQRETAAGAADTPVTDGEEGSV